MSYFAPDTNPEVEKRLMRMLREASPLQKLRMVGELNASVRALALAGLRQRHPHADEAELRRRLASILLGEELAERAYGPLQEEKRAS
ncbi:MAG: hypothetical protein GXP42_15010 [Chloroflexi bacterium]|nr:hypothetical protein [Chloroflexota bacterium]